MVLAGLAAGHDAIAQDAPAGDAGLGQVYFQQACAICHSATLGPGNSVIVKQGPCLVGLVGRRAGTSLSFNYTKALSDSGIVWSPTTLDKFLQNPMLAVPGTIMPMPVPDDTTRRNLIAYLATMAVPPGVTLAASITPAPVGTPSYDPGDWRNAAPGVTHHITVADLPAPYSTVSSGNNPRVVRVPTNAVLSVPPGFTVRRFATGFSDPRLLCVAPNGDIFIAETRANRIRVLRAVDGADAPTDNQIYATNLDRPFGIAFYPPGNDPQWVYVANNNSVVRFPYHRGDLTASGDAQVIVPHLADTTGGHTTRTLAFSNDGQCLFISVGSGSNVAEDMSKKNPADTAAWAATHVLGEAWDADVNRADVLVADPEGKQPLQIYAAGIRNGAGLAVNPVTGELWTASNERDALGDNLVPDYLTRVKPGGFYGWPWYYLGNHEDPRHAGERPDLAGSVTVPDVLFQSHSAPLEIAFYTASNGVAAFPAEYRGDVFVAFHGSWNRSLRTGYKVVWVHVDHGVPTGEYDDFMTGFVLDNRNVWGRPVGVAVAHDGALLVTDDGGNAVWRVAYTGH
jgi:hypothetical protein